MKDENTLRFNGPVSDGPYIAIVEQPTEITFNLDHGTEVLRLAPNGDIFVHGRLVVNDIEVVDGLREWLNIALTAQRKHST